MTLVSVIVPIYKVEDYLCKCIDSILSQTYTNMEIILVDDGSPDNCGMICDEYAGMDARIKVIHKSNGGLSDARNAGLDICTGEYIVFVDSDDWVNEDYIATFMEYAQSDTMVCCGYKYHRNGGVVIYDFEKKQIYSSYEAIEAMQEHYLGVLKGEVEKNPFSVVVWNKLYPRDFFLETRFPFGRKFEDGYIMFELLLKCKKIIVVPGANYNYIYRASSICHNISKESCCDFLVSRIKQENDVKDFTRLYLNAKKITLNAYMYIYLNYIRGHFNLNIVEKKEIINYLGDNKEFISIKDKKLFCKYFFVLYCEKILRLFFKIKKLL